MCIVLLNFMCIAVSWRLGDLQPIHDPDTCSNFVLCFCFP